jgi:hypothetical protein
MTTEKIRIADYSLSCSPEVQAFFAIVYDGVFRFDGLALLRNGEIESARLTWNRYRQRFYRDAITILDTDLRAVLVAEIREALDAYIAKLPPGERSRPPVVQKPPKPKQPAVPVNGKLKTSGQRKDKLQANLPEVQPPRVEAAPAPPAANGNPKHPTAVEPHPPKRPVAAPKPTTTPAPRAVPVETLPHRSAIRPPVSRKA